MSPGDILGCSDRAFTATRKGQEKKAITTGLFFFFLQIPCHLICLLLLSVLVRESSLSVSECAHCRTFCVCTVWVYANDYLRTSDVILATKEAQKYAIPFCGALSISQPPGSDAGAQKDMNIRVTTPSRMKRCQCLASSGDRHIWNEVRTSRRISRYSR